MQSDTNRYLEKKVSRKIRRSKPKLMTFLYFRPKALTGTPFVSNQREFEKNLIPHKIRNNIGIILIIVVLWVDGILSTITSNDGSQPKVTR
jgi:hypothetical protein